ncbi:MAG: CDP-alcohol phosphatidyltransferase family protein [Tepidisphaeraceae bacterium]|jgi:CDP-diacylglycerol--glycerol-3-phosphate 3-phosphatidyltransferase
MRDAKFQFGERGGDLAADAQTARTGLLGLNWANIITSLRLILLPLFLWIIIIDARRQTLAGIEPRRLRWLAIGLFVVMALTDKLDGYLARRLKQTTRIGALLDPLADKVLIACSLILLSFPWAVPANFEIPLPVLVAVFAKDAGVAIGALGLIASAGKVEIGPRLLGKVSTALQLALILATLIAVDLENLSPRLPVVLVCGLWALVPVVVAAASIDYALIGVRQYAQFRRRDELVADEELTEAKAI